MLLVILSVLAGAKPLLGPALLFWSVRCHDWRHIWKTCYSETMMENSCTKNLEESWRSEILFRIYFRFFCHTSLFRRDLFIYRQFQPSWEIVTTTSKEATNAAWSIARRGQPAGSSSWADISHRFQPASEIYYDLCLDLWNDNRIYYCRWYCYFLVMQSLDSHTNLNVNGLNSFVRTMYVHTPLAIFSVEPRSCDCTWADSSIPSTISLWNDIGK